MSERFSTFAKPRGTWLAPLGRDEKIWVAIAAIWGIGMFFMIAVIWPMIGNEQNEIISYRMTSAEFHERMTAFVEQYQVGEADGVPVVAPPPGGDVYVEAQAFAWRPVIQLQQGKTYRFLISSRDLQHGFSLVMAPHSINYQILPGYITSVELTPEETGEYPIICNEYCGLGHHLMTGRIVVVD